MTINTSETQDVRAMLEKGKSAFSNFNMVRMREAMRYLSGPKLSLFISIPFYLHTNQPGLPGFIKSGPLAHGILNFESSGFYKAGLKQGLSTPAPDPLDAAPPPCILGLYHIGSLGTFTQSAASDFDYWIIIDKTRFSPKEHKNFQQKLDDIVRYARETCGQKVSFFIMDQAEIRQDCYTGLAQRETLTAPKLFLKEEFYRTFLYIAGKIPLWAVIPTGENSWRLSRETNTGLCRDFLDIGDVGPPKRPDILKGILWHIVKSRADPVKALIKATMIFVHQYGDARHSGLLCDAVKSGYKRAGIDDYRTDPYKILFDRIITFHETLDTSGLNLIKNGVLLRLCGFPNVKAPEEGSPKKQLLDRYIRQWNLKPGQVKKILAYPDWAEGEKQLLETTFFDRLSQMYARISKDAALDSLPLEAAEKRNLTILFNKARERVSKKEGLIRPCSTYLRSQPFEFFILQYKKTKGWQAHGYLPGQDRPTKLHQCPSLLGLMGWIMENQIYRRTTGHLKLDTVENLYESADVPCNPDALYLRCQPVKPLSDDVFENPAQWRKIMVLLVFSKTGSGPDRAEFLALNSWGSLFVTHLDLDTALPPHDRYKQIIQILNQYPGNTIRVHIFQLAAQRDPDAVHQIMAHLNGRFSRPLETGLSKRPILDKL